jgi:hypothetical protein
LVVNDAALDYAFEHAAALRFIQFTGGESFLMEQHYRLLEHLLAVNPDVQIVYDTNGSATSYRNWAAVDLLRRFNRVPHVNFSIDGLGEKAQYIRRGFDYDTWLSSWRTFEEYVSVGMNYTVTVLSAELLAASLPQLAQDTGQYPFLSLCHKPLGFSFHAVPAEYRSVLCTSLENLARTASLSVGNGQVAIERLRHMRRELDLRLYRPEAHDQLRAELDEQERYRKPERGWRQLWPQLA